ncbi:MAG: hypothetical protein JWP00_2781 [Chloroflexi bacterium]|jgi:hypothetical protein|nr:hypothetical protein [Chloroflexota bacterium]
MTYEEFEQFVKMVPDDIEVSLKNNGRNFMDALKQEYAALGVTLTWPIKDLDTGNPGIEVSTIGPDGIKYSMPFILT